MDVAGRLTSADVYELAQRLDAASRKIAEAYLRVHPDIGVSDWQEVESEAWQYFELGQIDNYYDHLEKLKLEPVLTLADKVKLMLAPPPPDVSESQTEGAKAPPGWLTAKQIEQTYGYEKTALNRLLKNLRLTDQLISRKYKNKDDHLTIHYSPNSVLLITAALNSKKKYQKSAGNSEVK